MISPPFPLAPVVSPTSRLKLPPLPTLPVPILNVISPALPPVASPVVTTICPDDPALVVPVVRAITPLTPLIPELAVFNRMLPLDVAVLKPVRKLISPPVAVAVVVPDSICIPLCVEIVITS